MLKIILRVLLFGLSVLLFWVGLFASLQVNPMLGSALWIAAGVLVVGTLLWMILDVEWKAYMLKIIARVILFSLSVVVFWAGLFAGLQVNPTLGSALWVAAGVIFVGTLLWTIWDEKRK